MRLLHAGTLSFHPLESFRTLPRYAILSHAWRDDEVTYQEMRDRPDRICAKQGFTKITAFAERALANEFQFVWVDTCCIDKTSSAELSEAINSMFRLYREASICYVYLDDVPSFTGDAAWDAALQASRWFTRGWTLQELIAPRELEFYATDWTCVGTKRDLGKAITARTGIPPSVMEDCDFSKCSIAQRMSWAAGRSTSRREDAAYCLMGLFDVNMPMLYGEGNGAFLRLQQEIIKNSDDMSIFAWVDTSSPFSAYHGLLAHSPSHFAQCGDIKFVRGKSNEPYHITNKGIRLHLALEGRDCSAQELVARLPGVFKEHVELGIFLQKVGEEQYARVEASQLAYAMHAQIKKSLTPCFVRQNIFMEIGSHSRAAGIRLSIDANVFEIVDVQPCKHWNLDERFYTFEPHFAQRETPAAVMFTLKAARTGASGIQIIVDIRKPWGSVVQINGGWNKTPATTQFTHKIHCRKPHQPVIEIAAERGVFSGDARIVVAVKSVTNDDDQVPGTSSEQIPTIYRQPRQATSTRILPPTRRHTETWTGR
ncbi:hypothetical protein TI39_contig622g00004 [Zymoseptoria brevis]|uniref:Heterokaryon incompatibility domain-containing protein n=1 Tax=Zymoseptoria brevis TaxID=1047168 RepID=A0A0F4GGC0_9PEZI|nr:hypothetical protein TI39_contig622g00004 [Zymoseptoria brevis]